MKENKATITVRFGKESRDFRRHYRPLRTW